MIRKKLKPNTPTPSELKQVLIKLVKQHPVLWNCDPLSKKYEHDFEWQNISKTIRAPVLQCKKVWIELREKFFSVKNQNWKYYEHLNFLKEICLQQVSLDAKSKPNDEKITSHEEFQYIDTDTKLDNSESSQEYEEMEDIKSTQMRGKYGEVFLQDNIFFYCCYFCEEQFTKADRFQEHCMIHHLSEKHTEQTSLKPEAWQREDLTSEISSTTICEENVFNNNAVDSPIEDNEDLNIDMELEEDDEQFEELDVEADGDLDCIVNNNEDNCETSIINLCALCDFKTSSDTLFYEHCNEKHDKEFNECKEKFKDDKSVVEHRAVNNHPLQCKICGRIFKFSRSLVIHLKTHFKPDPEQSTFGLNCKYCGKKISKIGSLQLHEEMHEHKLKSPNFDTVYHEMLKCGSCEFETQVIKEFKEHCKKHIEAGETPFKCWICNKILSHYGFLIYHLNSDLHVKRDPVYKRCEEIEKKKKKRIYRCKYCNTQFCSARKVEYHENKHLDVRPYKCDFCSQEYYSKDSAQIHMRVNHLNDLRFACKTCGKPCLRQAEALQHEASHYGQKLYVCDICGSSYTASQSLLNHLKQHRNSRNYKCDKCNKAFNTQNRLTLHMVVHSEERNFKCELCSRDYKTKKGLRQHNKVHLKNKDDYC